MKNLKFILEHIFFVFLFFPHFCYSQKSASPASHVKNEIKLKGKKKNLFKKTFETNLSLKITKYIFTSQNWANKN